MGGIVGSKGFDFQTRYTVCHLPVWLQEGTFHQLFSEGTGDIDIRYLENGKSTRKHIQTKDHEVSPSEFKEVVDTFRGFDAGLPGVYQEFIMACSSAFSSAPARRDGTCKAAWRQTVLRRCGIRSYLDEERRRRAYAQAGPE
jgi:hypothetical protein